MKIQVEDQKPCKKALKISLPGAEIKDLHQKVVLEFQERSTIPGFRKGNAPLKVIESRFSKDIRSEVLRRLLPKVCSEAFKAEKISAVSDPLVDQIEYDLEKGLTFQAVVDILPQVALPKYKELKLEQDSLKVTEEEIDRTLEELREHHAVFQPVSGRSLNYGDYAVVEYHLDGQKRKKDDDKNIMIFIQQNEKEGISDQLVGMEIGQAREATLEATDQHPKRTFNIKLNEIKEKKLPEIDEEFFKTLEGIKNLDELRAKLKEDIKIYKEKASREALRNKAILTLSDKSDFDVPQSQVDHEAQKLYSELVNRVRQGSVSAKSLEDEQVRKDLGLEAIRRVKVAYILHEIAQKEDLKVSDDEVNQEIAHMAERLGKTPEELRANFEKNERLGSLQARLLQDKVIDFIVEHAIIKEKS
jgi:trigger factor